MNDYSLLEEKLDYVFRDKNLIIEALTHKSYKKTYNNERLEFLGDAVLDLIVGEYLYAKFPKENEGVLSKIRASLVNERGFTLIARSIDLGSYIYLSSAEENNNGRDKPSLLSNAFESVMGAIYLDSDLTTVEKISIKLIENCHPKIDLKTLSKDYKTALQELTQSIYGVTPIYDMIASFGPDHKKEFEIAIILDDKELARAKGKSKKEAQQNCAKIALKELKK